MIVDCIDKEAFRPRIKNDIAGNMKVGLILRHKKSQTNYVVTWWRIATGGFAMEVQITRVKLAILPMKAVLTIYDNNFDDYEIPSQ